MMMTRTTATMTTTTTTTSKEQVSTDGNNDDYNNIASMSSVIMVAVSALWIKWGIDMNPVLTPLEAFALVPDLSTLELWVSELSTTTTTTTTGHQPLPDPEHSCLNPKELPPPPPPTC